jgi:hypothetical protein
LTTPAAPASADPIRKVIAMVRLMLTPISAAASRSAAVERIARPSRVRPMNSCSENMSTTATLMMKMLSTGMLALPTWITQLSGKILGELVWKGPYTSCTRFCRMNDTPMAVISGARRGAFRSGL